MPQRHQAVQQGMGWFLDVQIAEQFLVFLVIENDPAGLVKQGKRNRRRIDNRFDQYLLVADHTFEAVHLGKVAVHAKKMRRVALAIDDG